MESLDYRYPRRFRLKQRLALRALGKQYDMIGYLAMQPGGDFRALAMGEMGGRVFDLGWKNGGAEILKKPDKMPPKPLLDGVIGDIRHLFTNPALTSATLRHSEDAGLFLSIQEDHGLISDYFWGRQSGPQLIRSLESDGRRILREAVYSDYKLFKGFERKIPARIVLNNYRWHYTLEIENLEISQ